MASHRGQRFGYVDVGPRVKQYGHFESADEEQIDPKILQEEARKAEAALREYERRGPQSFATMRWSPEGGVSSAPFRARPSASAQGGAETAAGFPAPPPEPPVEPGWGAVPMEPPPGSSWPSASASPWPNETVRDNPSPYGPPPIPLPYAPPPIPSPYGPPPIPSPYGPPQGGSSFGR